MTQILLGSHIEPEFCWLVSLVLDLWLPLGFLMMKPGGCL
jgi:hypothetical protein